MFIVGGFNAYPAEIEALLLHHEGLAQAAVIGVPDAALGEAAAEPMWCLGPERSWIPPTWSPGHGGTCRTTRCRRVLVVDTLPVNANASRQGGAPPLCGRPPGVTPMATRPPRRGGRVVIAWREPSGAPSGTDNG